MPAAAPAAIVTTHVTGAAAAGVTPAEAAPAVVADDNAAASAAGVSPAPAAPAPMLHVLHHVALRRGLVEDCAVRRSGRCAGGPHQANPGCDDHGHNYRFH